MSVEKASSFDQDGMVKKKTSSSMEELAKPRSASFNSIEEFTAKSGRTSPTSPKADCQTSQQHSSNHHYHHHLNNILNASPLKGLKKKLHSLKISKSNSDITCQIDQEPIDKNPNHDPNRLLPYPTHQQFNVNTDNSNKSPKEIRKVWQKDEMRKKKNLENNNSPYTNGSNTDANTNSHHDRLTSTTSDTLSVSSTVANNRELAHQQRGSQDSNDHYMVVETLTHDDFQDSPSENDECDGYQAPEEYTHQEIDRLLKKVDKTKEELRQMQATKDEYVKEYLKSAGIDDSSEVALKTKLTKFNFEKNNQKTNASIQLLQKKLEKYQLQLKVLEERGIHGHKRIIRAVQDSVRSGASSLSGAVSKPLGSLNNFMKKDKKNTSLDNVSAQVTQNEEMGERGYSVNNISDEDSSSCSNQILGSSHHSDIDFVPGGDQLHQVHNFTEQINLQNVKIDCLVKENDELKTDLTKVKDDVERMMTSLQEERYKNEQLNNEVNDMYHQWHDLTELHQNEMSGLKQEMDQTLERIECMEYRFAERSGDIEEAVGSCETRITKMELQQQQQQQLLLSVGGYFDAGGTTKALLTKLLSLAIFVVTIVLYFMSTITKLLMPFTTSRTRIITSVVTAICIVVFMKATDNGPSTICDFFSQLLYPFYMRLASSIASEDESSQMPSQSESIGDR